MPLNWSKIIESLQERRLIPILGSDAVPVVRHGKTAPLHEFIAKQLRARLKRAEFAVPPVAAEGLRPFVRDVCQHPANLNRARNLLTAPLRQHLVEIHHLLLAGVKPAPHTSALRLFAPLPLILSTDIDGAATLALTQACGIEPRSLNLKRITTQTLEDLPDDWESPRPSQPAPLLYHLFGRIERQDTFALTEDETLEVFWKLQGPDAPRNLREALVEKDIILLGSGFPDWLLRFLLRLARGRPFADPAEFSFNLIAERHLLERTAAFDTSLHAFLNQFHSSNVWIYRESDPTQFMARLEAEVSVRRKHRVTLPEKPSDKPAPKQPKGRHVFISYAVEDVTFAKKLAGALTTRLLPTWFDQDRMKGGEELNPALKQGIEDAHLFVPIISTATNSSASRRAFVEEWKYAIAHSRGIQLRVRPFIVPILIGDIAYSELAGEAKSFQDMDLVFRSVLGDDPHQFELLISQLAENYRRVELALRGQTSAAP